MAELQSSLSGEEGRAKALEKSKQKYEHTIAELDERLKREEKSRVEKETINRRLTSGNYSTLLKISQKNSLLFNVILNVVLFKLTNEIILKMESIKFTVTFEIYYKSLIKSEYKSRLYPVVINPQQTVVKTNNFSPNFMRLFINFGE